MIGVHMLWTPGNKERDGWAQAIYDSLANELHMDTHTDPDRNGLIWNARRAWRCAAQAAEFSHHLYIADDMMPVNGAPSMLRRLVEIEPGRVIFPFNMRASVADRLMEQERYWSTGPGSIYGNVSLWPHHLMVEFSDWVESIAHLLPDWYHHDDGLMGLWFEQQPFEPLGIIPSLFSHIGAGQSLLGQANARRDSRHFATPDLDLQAGRSHPHYFGSRRGPKTKAVAEILKGAGVL